MRTSSALLAILAGAALTGCHGQAGVAGVSADGDWEPQRDVTMIVPFTAGGGSDVFARATAAALEEVRPGVNVVVENRPAGSGAVGYGHFAAQAGDPHHLLAAEPVRNLLPEMMDTPFDWDDWTDIGQVAEDIALLTVDDSSEWQDFDEFLSAAEAAEEAGRPFRVALPSGGGVDEVLLYRLEEESGIGFEPIVFDGTGETNPALMAGDVEATILNPSDGRTEIQGEIFRPLLGFTQEEDMGIDWLEGVPPAGSYGWEIGATKFRGLIAPQGTPEPGRDYWVQALREAAETDRFQEYVQENGIRESHYWGDEWKAFLHEWNAEVMPVAERMAD
ncbi:tripartite tricarboxylate transporter substrate binding protein [Nocardiopsis salina]|uniref:tripartite tricarboxylate transporter substrate binding protein n=1 Tax=Nocardiopsis salina TaxID=245836 RepID=UPI00034A9F0B|nr:tripartite tricarboxylate transporter substrate binding protein [Nocardiopsis salina]